MGRQVIRVAALSAALVFIAATSYSPGGGEVLEIRAAWVTRWAYKSADDVKALFSGLADMGVNTVFFQVRGAGDAFYRSSYEPWSELLTGTLGKDPGWDPLRVAVREGHKRGIEVHAWVNVFTAWLVTESGALPAVTLPLHPMLAHPDWIARDRDGKPMSTSKAEARDNYVFFSPTMKGVQDHAQKVINEIVGKYRVDGIHLDYVRFPDSSYSYDVESRVTYLKAAVREDISFAQWRTRELSRFVGDLARSIRQVRRGTRLSAATWQVIDAGRATYYQDGVGWSRQGYLDFVVPMIYTAAPGTFASRLETYADSVGAARVVAGIGAYLEGFDESVLAEEVERAIALRVRGVCVFNSDYALRYAGPLKALLRNRDADR